MPKIKELVHILTHLSPRHEVREINNFPVKELDCTGELHDMQT